MIQSTFVRLGLTLALDLAALGPVRAQDTLADDPRILTLPARPGGALRVPTSTTVTQVLLPPRGERVTSVSLSDPTALFLTVAASGDSVALHATGQRAIVLMTMRTATSTYAFELTTSEAATVPAIVRMTAPTAPPPAPSLGMTLPVPPTKPVGYRLSGNPALRPVAISDDGARTYIRWGADQAMPATFAPGPTGTEQMVEGYVRGGIFTIDRVYPELIFRIDREMARARRERLRGMRG